mgnify:CR=1 FL=1
MYALADCLQIYVLPLLTTLPKTKNATYHDRQFLFSVIVMWNYLICQVKENGVEGENHVAAEGELEEGEIADDEDSR